MPKLTEDEIKARIADGSLTAITLDTSIFDRYGCNLNFPLLRSLSQFEAGKIAVVFSDVIVSEVGSHITDKADETKTALNQAIKRFARTWKTAPVEADVAKVLQTDGDLSAFAEMRIQEFMKAAKVWSCQLLATRRSPKKSCVASSRAKHLLKTRRRRNLSFPMPSHSLV